jgi:hypothetical protein
MFFKYLLKQTLDKMTEKLKQGGEWESSLLPDPEVYLFFIVIIIYLETQKIWC